MGDEKTNQILESIAGVAKEGAEAQAAQTSSPGKIANSALSQADLDQAEISSLEFRMQKAKKNSRLYRNIFYSLLAISLLMMGYFYFQFEASSNFPGQAGLTVADTSAQVQLEKMDHDLLLYQLIRIDLEELSVSGARYIQTVDQGNPDIQLRKTLEEILTRISYQVNQLANQSAESPLEVRVELSTNLPPSLAQSSIKRLLGSRVLHEQLADAETIKRILGQPDSEFANFIKETIVAMPTPEGTLYSVALNKLSWSEIIVKIENITRAIDPNFSTSSQFIEYTNYNFNASTQKITLTGQVRTQDAKTFTLIADLIDSLENDPLFADVSMRSFSKNASSQADSSEGFQSALNLEFSYTSLSSNQDADV